MTWDVAATEAFEAWFDALAESERADVIGAVDALARHGPYLGEPFAARVPRSRHRQMRELRLMHEGRPYRVLFAFDPRRLSVSLLMGDATGCGRWHAEHVPAADRLYDACLDALRRGEMAACA